MSKCSECGSENLMPNLKIVDNGHACMKYDLAVELHGNPDAWIRKDTRKGVLMATVCGQCGKVDLSVDNPRELWEVYKRGRA